MEPCSDQDWRPAFTGEAVNEQVPSADKYGDREHDVLEFLRSDGARVWDRDVDVGDSRCPVHGLFAAERNDGVDALAAVHL